MGMIALANRDQGTDETRMEIEKFTDVTVHAKANVYFGGGVVSHTLVFQNGERKTVGVILPGSYHFGTKLAERMEIIEGEAEVHLDGGERPTHHASGHESRSFDVPSDSGFTITVSGKPCHYVCSFLAE